MTDAPVRVLPDVSSLCDGDGVRFTLRLDGVERAAFVVRWRGRITAWVNSCRHQSLPLDGGGGRFLDPVLDGIACVHHGALYRPDTGECIAGPCRLARLTALALELRGRELWCTGRAGGD